MKVFNVFAAALAVTSAVAEIAAPDGVDQGKLNEALAEAMNSMQPGTPEEQQGAMEDLKVVHIEGPLECEDEDRIEPKKYVSVEYVGTIAEGSETGEIGKIFDSSALRGGQTLDFQHSLGQVPRGFDFATNVLCQGVNVSITIPPLLAFGDQGNGGVIPGGATVHFNVVVKKVSVEDFRPEYNFFEHMDTDKDGLVSRKEMTDFMLINYRSGVPDELWNAADKNGDGYSDWNEFIFDKGEKKKRVINQDDEDKKAKAALLAAEEAEASKEDVEVDAEADVEADVEEITTAQK
jgi:FKBP-type peptidyl-prolyl cis-trans isomerase